MAAASSKNEDDVYRHTHRKQLSHVIALLLYLAVCYATNRIPPIAQPMEVGSRNPRYQPALEGVDYHI